MNLFVLEVLSSGALVRVAVNGITVVSVDEVEARTTTLNLNPYIVDGANSLAVALRLPGLVDGAPAPPAPGLTLGLRTGRQGVDPGDAGRVLNYVWQPEQHRLSADAWTVPFDQSFQAPGGFGRWAWQDAPTGPVSPSQRDALLADVLALHRHVAEGAVGAVMAAHQLKLAELARALGLAEDAMRADLNQVLTSIMRAPDFEVAPLQADRLMLEPLGQGRLVRVRLVDGQAPVRMSGAGRTLQMQPIFTQAQGRWIIAR